MRYAIYLLLLFLSFGYIACQKETPKTKAQIIGRYAVSVEYIMTNMGTSTTAFYDDTLEVTEGPTENQLKITSLNDTVFVTEQPTGSEASLQYNADTNGKKFSAVFFDEKSIQYESTSPTETRKHSGEKVSN